MIFPSQDRLAEEIMKRKERRPLFRWHGLLLDFSCISSVDSTALAVLKEILDDFQKRDLRLCFANLSQSVSVYCCTVFHAANACVVLDGRMHPVYLRSCSLRKILFMEATPLSWQIDVNITFKFNDSVCVLPAGEAAHGYVRPHHVFGREQRVQLHPRRGAGDREGLREEEGQGSRRRAE